MSQCRGYYMPVCSQVWVQIVDINMIIINTLAIPISALICMSVSFVLRKHSDHVLRTSQAGTRDRQMG